MDSAGRILIAPELRKAAGLKIEQKVMLVGLQHYFEIWDPDVLEAQEQKAIEGGLPEALANFSFQGDRG
jgi:MraZ protein